VTGSPTFYFEGAEVAAGHTEEKEVGSGLRFPCWWLSAAASFGPRSRMFGVCLRLMGFSVTTSPTATCFKAFVRWSFLQSRVGRWQSESAGSYGDFTMQGIWGPSCNFNFLEAFYASWVGSCPLYSCIVYR